jgi:hypothetical protein
VKLGHAGNILRRFQSGQDRTGWNGSALTPRQLARLSEPAQKQQYQLKKIEDRYPSSTRKKTCPKDFWEVYNHIKIAKLNALLSNHRSDNSQGCLSIEVQKRNAEESKPRSSGFRPPRTLVRKIKNRLTLNSLHSSDKLNSMTESTNASVNPQANVT